MIIEKEQGWGTIIYDTMEHRFSYVQKNGINVIPYARKPVLLNVDLTMKCNMSCRHCVAKDFGQMEDLVVSPKMISWINKSPFMVVVITGGEPLLPEYDKQLITLLREIQGKGLIVDTNGTIIPSKLIIDAIVESNTLVRVSWDSINPYDEMYFRQVKPHNTLRNRNINREYYFRKIDMIQHFRSQGVNVAVQSIIHKKNIASILTSTKDVASILDMPVKLRELSIKQWYLQRYIPSYQVASSRALDVSNSEYETAIHKLSNRCQQEGIECIAKRDRRHNSVFLLVGNGLLFTQGEKPREKIPLGTIQSHNAYFDYVSSPDHSDRYYRKHTEP